MENVLEYRESYGEEHPSIVSFPTHILDEELKHLLFDYMTNKDFLEWIGFGECLTSPFTNEKIPALGNTLTDGTYRWCDDLPIYMKDNDIALPDEFIQHVINATDVK